MSQEPLALDLFPELPAPVAPPKRRAAKATLQSTAAPLATRAPARLDGDLEPLAQTLEAHPDYRVLRRLQPRVDWGPARGGATATVLVLDTETTGLDAQRERVIELALLRVQVDLSDGLPVGPVQVYDGLEDPGKPIPKEVVALTGIRDADVRGQRLDETRIAELLDGVDCVIAHNAAFDRPFVEKRLPQFADLRWSCSFAEIDWKQQGRSSAKLESLAQALGWFYDAHRAEMDCHALLAVLAAPLTDPAVADPSGAAQATLHTALAHLLRSAAAPSYRLQATQAPFDAKDALKARGYRWNADQRVWGIALRDDEALRAECDWLKHNVYAGRAASVQLEALDALSRYAGRGGVARALPL
ncbi:3'-5' exonuclease [Rhodoferax sp.]|uniref:3'-5' exonuclease n=1 Tax=Rhodoferax sp. TaxID=50421 RepID=UPI0037852BF1